MNNKKVSKEYWLVSIPIVFLLYIMMHYWVLTDNVYLKFGIYFLGLILVVIIAVLFMLYGIIKSLIKRRFTKSIIIGLICLFTVPLIYVMKIDTSGYFYNAFPLSIEQAQQSKIAYRFPMDTTCFVAWGGDAYEHNYHITAPDQRWAYDMVMIQDSSTFNGDSTQLESYLIYGQPIIAAADGVIKKLSNDMPDEKPGHMNTSINPYGNYIVLETAPKEELVYCHLKPNSMKVSAGQAVKQGDTLALVGNSGHTSEPHLHIHLQYNHGEDFEVGMPLYFYNYSYNGVVVNKGMPLGGLNTKKDSFIPNAVKHLPTSTIQ